MKFNLSLLAVAIGILQIANARDGDWFKKRMQDLEQVLSVSDISKKISQLGEFVRIGTHGGMDEEQQQIFDRAQSAMLAIPGHAKYYQDRIESMRAEALANAKRPEAELTQLEISGKAAIGEWDFHEIYRTAFSALCVLPSPETVTVLGAYLNDPLGRDGKSLLGHHLNVGGDTSPIPGPAASAAIAISKLGIESPPFDRPGASSDTNWTDDQEIDAWKDWWNEVKAGKRTYRFAGSSIEYGPDGPVSTEQLQKIERDRKRTEERAAGHHKTGGKDEGMSTGVFRIAKPASVAALLAACLLVVGAVAYYLRKQAGGL